MLRCHPLKNAIDDRAVVLGPAPASMVCGIYRQQPFQNGPFRFAQITSAQSCLQITANLSMQPNEIIDLRPIYFISIILFENNIFIY